LLEHVFVSEDALMTRSKQESERVQALIAEGRNDCEAPRLTRIPRPTVRDWRRGLRVTSNDLDPGETAGSQCGGFDVSTLPPEPYSYLLGMYLGDGCLSLSRRRVRRLRVTTDARYPGIIEEYCRAMEAVMLRKRAYKLHRPSRCVEVHFSNRSEDIQITPVRSVRQPGYSLDSTSRPGDCRLHSKGSVATRSIHRPKK
jgi:hypothetical protein